MNTADLTPGAWYSRITYRVPYADTDQMGVVYYANYLVYFERLRNQLMDDLGLPYAELERLGYALPVVEAHVRYVEPARYDDRLEVRGRLAWIRRVRLCVECTILRDDVLLADGYTIHACLDLNRGRRPTRIPAVLVQRAEERSVQRPEGGATSGRDRV